MTTQGGCLCGGIRYACTGTELWSAYCHCESCRSQTGAPVTGYVGFPLAAATFTGERSVYESSPGVRRGFCARCGTPLTYEADDHPGEIHLHTCTLDRPEDFPPTRHVFYSERVRWLELTNDLPKRD